MSPAFGHDHALVCVHPDSQGTRVLAVTTTAGRTWRDAAMSGLVRPTGPLGAALTATLSPAFGSDHELFATTGSGTYASTDFGATFTPVDTLTKAGATDNPVAFFATSSAVPLAGGSGQHVLLAYAASPLPALIDPATDSRRPALGVPGLGALRFVAQPAAGQSSAGQASAGQSSNADDLLAVVNVPDSPTDDHTAVYRCDAALTCAQPLFVFPAGIRFGTQSRVTAMPDHSLLAVLDDSHGSPQVWRSIDGGATFTPMRSVARVIAALGRGGAPPSVSFAATAAHPHRVFLRVEASMPVTGWKSGSPPASQLFRSDDSGVTWRLVAFGRSVFQPGSRGTLPWRLGPANGHQIQLAPDGRLLADGSSEAVTTTWCSVDGGMRWTAGCR
ncbi:MAG: exo-alpha-sialidase [Frankiales bacterium]|nr:exo-alpha-sialidase [Frankiales bacterium]